MAASYYGEHINPSGWYEFFVKEETNRIDYNWVGTTVPRRFIRMYKTRMDSRHSNSTRNQLFVLLNQVLDLAGINQIEEIYCTCKVDDRTIGACAYLVCLIWRLSYACYQEDITLPAHSFSIFFNDVKLLPDIDEDESDDGSDLQNRRENQLEDLVEKKIQLVVKNPDQNKQEEEEEEKDQEQEIKAKIMLQLRATQSTWNRVGFLKTSLKTTSWVHTHKLKQVHFF